MFASPLAEHFAGLGFTEPMATLTWAFTLANSLGPIPMIVGGYINDNIGPKWSIFIGGIFFGGGVFVAGCSFITYHGSYRLRRSHGPRYGSRLRLHYR